VRVGIAQCLLVVTMLGLSSPLAGSSVVAWPAAAAEPARTGVHSHVSATSARALYLQAIARLLGQKRFELNEILHFGVRSQPEYYHWRLRAITPDRQDEERNDRPPDVLVQVGTVQCDGPSRWFCRHGKFPGLAATVNAWLLPWPQLTHLAFSARETPASIVIMIRAHGDPWQCPPFAITCPIPGFNERSFQDRSRYTATLIVDRPSGLPGSLTSTVTMGFYNLVSPAQRMTFSYNNVFSVDLPRYPKLKCPGHTRPGTWCMREPGA
jgi:hypothetical protein